MEVAKELVKTVARSFYEDKYSVLLDFLLRERMYSCLEVLPTGKESFTYTYTCPLAWAPPIIGFPMMS